MRGLLKTRLHICWNVVLARELMLRFAERNGVALGWGAVDALRQTSSFQSLLSFLDLYFETKFSAVKSDRTGDDWRDSTRRRRPRDQADRQW